MAFDTREKRFSAIHWGKWSGLPVPHGKVDETSRFHFIGCFVTILPLVVPFFFWRPRGLQDQTRWQARGLPPGKFAPGQPAGGIWKPEMDIRD